MEGTNNESEKAAAGSYKLNLLVRRKIKKSVSIVSELCKIKKHYGPKQSQTTWFWKSRYFGEIISDIQASWAILKFYIKNEMRRMSSLKLGALTTVKNS